MNRKDSPQSVIDSYRRRQQMAPYFLAGLAILLVVVGIIILVIWFTGNNGKVSPVSLFASATPTVTPVTPTATFTQVPPTNTPVPPTNTAVPTETLSPTPSGPVEYTIQEGDNCWDLALKAKVDLEVLLALNNFGNSCPIKPGDKILIPVEGSELPTSTAVPKDMTGKIEYVVMTGDTIASIASRYNSTADAIVKENKIKDVNKINVGDKLIIPVNIVTPTPTKAPSATPTLGVNPPTATATETKKP
jgi:LysM repeat protein